VGTQTDRKEPAPLDIYLMYLDATLGQSERCAASIERLAAVERTRRDPPLSPESIGASLSASSALLEQSRILVKNAREACDLLHQLRAECEMLRRPRPVEKPAEERRQGTASPARH